MTCRLGQTENAASTESTVIHVSMKSQGDKKRSGSNRQRNIRKKKPFSNKQQGSQKRRKLIINFDPEARRDYLQGFSERKRQRRAYGLAMQQVKDRKSKISERKETRQAELERIEQAESQKEELLFEKHGQVEGHNDIETRDTEASTITTTYQDVQTQSQFGGQVIVTTTTLPPSDVESNADEDSPGEKVSVDAQQQYCGSVKKYLQKFKGNMPSKKKHAAKHKGRHGAATMKGMGGSADLKLAQKALSKSKAKSIKNDRKGGRGSSSSHGGKRGKR